MREIKFRAWNYKKLIYNVSVRNSLIQNHKTEFNYIDNSNYHIMQFTGLKDKNGVEIYEGDIILKDDEKIVVSYGIQEVDAFEGVGFNLWSFYGKQKDVGKAIRLQSEIEVIGNIYENPELLKL